jgi:hypothetical protein
MKNLLKKKEEIKSIIVRLDLKIYLKINWIPGIKLIMISYFY